ncbi:hypothetical protein [Escherichia coli]|uniref:hypothetical protein n=1 Tax=Escherichia coli TaxID=562 RepID=UPI000DDE8B20|nr:hypothetical protein [Escherichia coli]
MVVKNGLACGIMLALVGCATKPVSNEQATPVPEKQIISTALLEKRDGTGEVIIKRDSGFFGSACFSRVYVDGKEVADLGTAQKVVVYPTIGDHVFSAWPKGVCGGGMSEQAGNVTTDRTLMYRIGYGSNGEYGIHPTAF